MYNMHLLWSIAMRSNLELKTRPKQLLGSLPVRFRAPRMDTCVGVSLPLHYKATNINILQLNGPQVFVLTCRVL